MNYIPFYKYIYIYIYIFTHFFFPLLRVASYIIHACIYPSTSIHCILHCLPYYLYHLSYMHWSYHTLLYWRGVLVSGSSENIRRVPERSSVATIATISRGARAAMKDVDETQRRLSWKTCVIMNDHECHGRHENRFLSKRCIICNYLIKSYIYIYTISYLYIYTYR